MNRKPGTSLSESIEERTRFAGFRTGKSISAGAAAVVLAAVMIAAALGGGCGDKLDTSGGLYHASSGTASGTVRFPETLAPAARAAAFATAGEVVAASVAVTLERLGTDGAFTPLASSPGATTDSDGNFVLDGIPLNEANLIVKAQLDTGAGGALIMRSVLRELTPIDYYEDGFMVNIDTTFTAEGFRRALQITNDNMNTTKTAADYDEDLIMKNLYSAVHDGLLAELNRQETSVTISDVLSSANSLADEFFKLKETETASAVDAAWDALKPATSTASPPGSPAGDRYYVYDATSTVDVILSADESSADIYFTTDNSTPTLYSEIFESPITCSDTTTIRFFALDGNGNRELTNTVKYDFQ